MQPAANGRRFFVRNEIALIEAGIRDPCQQQRVGARAAYGILILSSIAPVALPINVSSPPIRLIGPA
jgi:hypothetical protein